MDSHHRRRSPSGSPGSGPSGPRRQEEASPPRKRRVFDTDPRRARERERQEQERALLLSKTDNSNASESAKDTTKDPVKEYKRLMELKSGGRYVPPAKLRALQEQISASESPKQYQRIQWDKLKKTINGSINKVNTSNIKEIAIELFKCNIVRGRGVLIRSVIKAQAFSRSYTPVYASLMAIINSKFPEIGELLIKRLILQFRRSFKRKDKAVCLNTCVFIAHLCNQLVAHEILCLQILHLLLKNPTDDLVEIAVAFVKEAGAYISIVSAPAFQSVFDRLTAVLHEGNLDKRTEYMIEALFQVRREGFQDNPTIPEGLDLVEDEDQETHLIALDEEDIKGEESLNVFKFDENYEQTEKDYEAIKAKLFGDDESDSESDSDSNSVNVEDGRGSPLDSDGASDSDSDTESADENMSKEGSGSGSGSKKMYIRDMTDTQLMNLKKAVYLSIMSTMSVDEICHKLLKIDVSNDHKIEVVNMIVECCAQEKIYNRIYGLVGSKFCRMTRPIYDEIRWEILFIQAFNHYYSVIHRYETNKLRNIATMFGYMLASDSLSWSVFESVKMNEHDSTPSSRIFVKIMFQEMRQELGVKELAVRFKDSMHQDYLYNMMPKDPKHPEDTRFSINYFTAIDLGVLTEDMREFLENLPSPASSRSSSRSGSRSSSVGSTGSYSGSDRGRTRSRRRSYSASGSDRSGSYSRSRSRSYSGSYSSRSRSGSYSSRSYSSRSYSRSGSYSRSRSRSYSRSRSRSYSRSRSGSYSTRSRSYSRSKSGSRSRSRSPRRTASPRPSYPLELDEDKGNDKEPLSNSNATEVPTEPPAAPTVRSSNPDDSKADITSHSEGTSDSAASRSRPNASDYFVS